jgi:hypothetical protein
MRFLLFILSVLSLPSFAFDIPTGLSASDRREVIRTVGMNSAMKILSNPYPLGGYSGFEVGYSLEFINVRDVSRLGGTSVSSDSEWRIARLTFAKGLYRDIDMSISFSPPSNGMRATDFGGALRWSFFQAEFLPINLSAVVNFNQMNFSDKFMNRNFGGDMIVGVNVDNFALYFGGGMVEAHGTFIGGTGSDATVPAGDPELSGKEQTVVDKIQETHTVVGISLHYENLFAAAQVDRYVDAVYSLKVGLRF